ncbi:GNAT family N-acetyltransferase [Planomonospora sp. ID82291]|uniref:GNAT family N-acetyltransferase n=1 Tax=Planomonospora sp. ID82291 TaxID=2738136 RepID=UPI0018C44117|nr:GNAT family N-acetyltransferase [Planomonospora sp. ID82291]MBG0814221.1 GNAT family N-acetyltransferase [Planomonospora sp. ID82291]
MQPRHEEPPARPSVVRPATPGDAALLAELNRHVHDIHVAHRPDLFRENPSAEDLTAGFRERIDDGSFRIFIAELPDVPAAGYAMAAVHRRAAGVLTAEDAFIVLEHLAVAPQATRRGVGTALLDAVREAGREAGCRRFVTEVWDFNTEALAFYEAAGFSPMRRLFDQLL